jgi:hypothetical protein
MPPLIPKRRNRRLKCALTVRSAIFKSLAISELSHPWRSRSMICRSRGPTWLNFSPINTAPDRRAPVAASGSPTRSLDASGFGPLRLSLHSRGQIGLPTLTNCKNSGCVFFCWENSGYRSHGGQGAGRDAQQFCAASRVNHLVHSSGVPPSKDHIYTEVHPQPVLARPL